MRSYQALAKASPTATDLLTTIAAVENELGVVCLDTGRFGEAGDAHRQALETLRTEPPDVAALPESRFELAKTYGYLSTPLLGRGSQSGGSGGGRHGPWHGWDRNNGPTENNTKAVEILQKLLAENPENPGYRLAMAHCQRDRYFLSARSHRDEADQARKEAVGILESLVAVRRTTPTTSMNWRRRTSCRPGPPGVQRRRPTTRSSFAGRRNRQGLDRPLSDGAGIPGPVGPLLCPRGVGRCLGRSGKRLSKAVDLEEKLAVEFASVASYRFSLVRSLHQLADVQMARHRWPQARASLEEEIAAWTKIE